MADDDDDHGGDDDGDDGDDDDGLLTDSPSAGGGLTLHTSLFGVSREALFSLISCKKGIRKILRFFPARFYCGGTRNFGIKDCKCI